MALAEFVSHRLLNVVRKPDSSSRNSAFILNPHDFAEMGDIMSVLGYEVTPRSYNWIERLARLLRSNHQYRSLKSGQVFEDVDEFLRQ